LRDLPQTCPIEDSLRVLSGKWRLLALFRLGNGPQRFNALQRALAPVTQKVLTTTLRGMEPPHVTYGLTERGRALGPVFTALARWQMNDVHAPSVDFKSEITDG
jgi:DNA-binding HxlR family transcriptional regulator